MSVLLCLYVLLLCTPTMGIDTTPSSESLSVSLRSVSAVEGRLTIRLTLQEGRGLSISAFKDVHDTAQTDAEGKHLDLSLWPNEGLLADDAVVTVVTSEGKTNVLPRPSVKNLYHGSVHTVAGTFFAGEVDVKTDRKVTLSGMIVLVNQAFAISQVATAEHGADAQSVHVLQPVSQHELHRLSFLSISSPLPKRHFRPQASFPNAMEEIFIADSAMSNANNCCGRFGDVNNVVLRLTQVANVVDAFFQQTGLGLRVKLTGLTVLVSNPFQTSSAPATFLDNIKTWGGTQTTPRDGMLVLTGASFIGSAQGLGTVNTGTYCAAQNYALARMEQSSSDSTAMQNAKSAFVATHEMGHNLGVPATHFSGTTCSGNFIMTASGYSLFASGGRWSSCTLAIVQSTIDSSPCLQSSASSIEEGCGYGYWRPTGSSSSEACRQCNSVCLSCSTSATRCTKCPSNQYLLNGVCVASCINGYHTSAGQDDSVPFDLRATGNICAQCNQSAATCGGGQVVACDSNGGNAFCAEAQALPVPIDESNSGGSSNGGAIAAGILVPLFVIGGFVAYVVYCRKQGKTTAAEMFPCLKQEPSSLRNTKPRTSSFNLAEAKTQSQQKASQYNAPYTDNVVRVSPPAPQVEPESPLPPNWDMHLDPATQANYYYNSATGESSWERPVQ